MKYIANQVYPFTFLMICLIWSCSKKTATGPTADEIKQITEEVDEQIRQAQEELKAEQVKEQQQPLLIKEQQNLIELTQKLEQQELVLWKFLLEEGRLKEAVTDTERMVLKSLSDREMFANVSSMLIEYRKSINQNLQSRSKQLFEALNTNVVEQRIKALQGLKENAYANKFYNPISKRAFEYEHRVRRGRPISAKSLVEKNDTKLTSQLEQFRAQIEAYINLLRSKSQQMENVQALSSTLQ